MTVVTNCRERRTRLRCRMRRVRGGAYRRRELKQRLSRLPTPALSESPLQDLNALGSRDARLDSGHPSAQTIQQVVLDLAESCPATGVCLARRLVGQHEEA